MNPLFYELALSLLPDVGPKNSRSLLSYCGSAEGVFLQPRSTLIKIPGIGQKIASSILQKKSFSEAEKEFNYCFKNGIKILSLTSDKYPKRLKQLGSAPLILYFKGDADLNRGRFLSIVGTRKPTQYGVQMCQSIIRDLKEYSCTIVSGLAYGIDICSHRNSLNYGIPTIGVMASGFEQIYPFGHRSVVKEMAHTSGGVLTEFPSQTRVDKDRFPARNRIIAGLSDGVLVVESKARGGSMITADFAFDFDREVMALTGRATDTNSTGCLNLIKGNKASLVTSAEDIAKILFWDYEAGNPNDIQRQIFVDLDEEEKVVIAELKKDEAYLFDDLRFKIGYKPGQLSSILLRLECKGLIKCIPGNKIITL